MLTDEQLFAGIRAGDKVSLERLYDRYETLVYSFAIRTVTDPMMAEEVVQDVFTKVWRAKIEFDPTQAKASTYLLTIARNVAIDQLRRRRGLQVESSQPDEQLVQTPSHEAGPDRLAEVNEVRTLLRRALDDLPDDQRETIQRMYLKGMTQQEIADEFQVPVGTIKSRVRLGLGKLKDKLRMVGMEGIQ